VAAAIVDDGLGGHDPSSSSPVARQTTAASRAAKATGYTAGRATRVMDSSHRKLAPRLICPSGIADRARRR
jgi:hypothetical protein